MMPVGLRSADKIGLSSKDCVVKTGGLSSKDKIGLGSEECVVKIPRRQ